MRTHGRKLLILATVLSIGVFGTLCLHGVATADSPPAVPAAKAAPVPALAPAANASVPSPRARPPRQENTLLLKDFKPKSMMHAKEHLVPRAKYPVVDFHTHVNMSGDPAKMIESMDKINLRTMVMLTSGWGEALTKMVDRFVKPYPGRFVAFTLVDWSRVDEPDFGQKMAAQIRDAVARGARGLKILKNLGLGTRYKSTGKLVAVDDPALDPIWAECGMLGIPVAIHISDPEAFFLPTDAINERYEELLDHPDWSFHGKDFPSNKGLIDARDRVFAKHPKTIWVALHTGGGAEDLDYVGSMLDKLPNVAVEFAARQAELGRQPRRSTEFFTKYQDRIMFGTDVKLPEEAIYANYFRWLETGDEYFPYDGYPQQGRWKIYGLQLPAKILKKVYTTNADKIFAQFKGKP